MREDAKGYSGIANLLGIEGLAPEDIGGRERPTQAMLDVLTIRRRKGRLGRLVVDRSLIRHQVEMGVALRMACLEILSRDLGDGPL